MTGPPQCRCGKEGLCLETKKSGPNQGRWFWKCATSTCNYFKWDTSGQFVSHLPQAYANAASGSSSSPRPLLNSQKPRRDFFMNRQADPGGAPTGQRASGQRPTAPTTVQFALHSRTTIAIKASYNQTLLPVLQNLEGATWDATEARWMIPATQSAYAAALRAMPLHTPNLNLLVEKLPPTVVSALPTEQGQPIKIKNAHVEQNDVEARLARITDSVLWNHLKEFQRTGVQEAIRRNGKMLLADEMGLGKTLQALGVALAYQDAWPVLVICPSSLRLTWKAEIKKWLKLSDSEISVGMKGSHLFENALPAKRTRHLTVGSFRKRMTTSKLARNFEPGMSDDSEEEEEMPMAVKFYVISYDLASRYSTEVQARRFKFIVCDESHYLKNRSSKRYKALAPILQASTRRILLSGTPVFSRPEELYTQLHVLWPNFFSSFQEFGARYCSGVKTVFGWDYSGASNLTELNIMLEESVLLRRLKKDVGLELPEKFRQTVFVDIPFKSKSTIKKIKAALHDIENSTSNKRSSDSQKAKARLERKQMMMDYYVQTGTIKIPVIEEYLNHVFESSGESKIIVFAYHLNVLNAIEETVKKHMIEYIRIDGSTDPSNRQNLCETFQESVKTKVAVLSLTAANVGLTLSMADIVVFAELFWNPSQLLQAEDRAHRIGRVGPVDIKYIICVDTLDDLQWQLVQKKLKVVGEAIDGSQTRVNLELSDSQASNQMSRSQPSRIAGEYEDSDDDDDDSDVNDDWNDIDEELLASLAEASAAVEGGNTQQNAVR